MAWHISFWKGTTVIVGALVVYFSTEEWEMLHSPRREHAFWLTAITAQVALLLIASDSPVRKSVLALLGANDTSQVENDVLFALRILVFVVLTVPLVAGYVLWDHKLKDLVAYNSARTRRERLARAYRTPFSARVKQVDVETLLDRLSYRSAVRYFASMLQGRVQERREKLRKIIEEASPEELNHLFHTVNLPRLLWFGDLQQAFEGGRSEVIKSLSVVSKAAVIHGMMRAHLMMHRAQREFVCKVFCDVKGDELTQLKNALDGSGDFNNLYKLVYRDMRDEDLVKRMLAHIAEQAAQVCAISAKNSASRPLKILSDVDDTLWSSGGRWPAGVDQTYPHHEVYPGALVFYEELDMHGASSSSSSSSNSNSNSNNNNDAAAEESDSSSSEGLLRVSVEFPIERGGGGAAIRVSAESTLVSVQHKIEADYKIPPWRQRFTVSTATVGSDASHLTRGHNLVFLSARPHAWKDVTENSSYRRFRALFEEGRMHTHPTLLAGNLRSGFAAVAGDVSYRLRGLAAEAASLLAVCFLAVDEKLLKHPPALQPLRQLAERFAAQPEGGSSSSSPLGGDDIDANANWQGVGLFKAESFEKFAALYPECEFCFVGDDGQGDVLAAETMAAHLKGTSKRPRAFIHRVFKGPAHQVLSNISPPESREEKWKELGIVRFETFVGAAAMALDAGLLEPRAVHRIAVSAREDMIEMALEHATLATWDANVEAFNRDVLKANEAIKRVAAARGRSKVLEIPKLEWQGERGQLA